MQNRQLWEAVLEYLEGQMHTKRTRKPGGIGQLVFEGLCNECRAIVAEQGHFSSCATGKLIAFIKPELDKRPSATPRPPIAPLRTDIARLPRRT